MDHDPLSPLHPVDLDGEERERTASVLTQSTVELVCPLASLHVPEQRWAHLRRRGVVAEGAEEAPLKVPAIDEERRQGLAILDRKACDHGLSDRPQARRSTAKRRVVSGRLDRGDGLGLGRAPGQRVSLVERSQGEQPAEPDTDNTGDPEEQLDPLLPVLPRL